MAQGSPMPVRIMPVPAPCAFTPLLFQPSAFQVRKAAPQPCAPLNAALADSSRFDPSSTARSAPRLHRPLKTLALHGLLLFSLRYCFSPVPPCTPVPSLCPAPFPGIFRQALAAVLPMPDCIAACLFASTRSILAVEGLSDSSRITFA